jgi:cell division protease FtsH
VSSQLNKVIKNLSIYLLIVLVVIALYNFKSSQTVAPAPLRYDQFIDMVNKGEVVSVTIQSGNNTTNILGDTKDGTNLKHTVPSLMKTCGPCWTRKE